MFVCFSNLLNINVSNSAKWVIIKYYCCISISLNLMCNICGAWPERINPPSQTSRNIMLHNAHYNALDWTSSPGYGTLPLVTSSVSRMPNDHTSDLMVNFPYRAASGAVHFIGNLAPKSNRVASVQIFKQQMFNVDYKWHKSTLHSKSCFGSPTSGTKIKTCLCGSKCVTEWNQG